jgi:hypothetical protein
MMVRRCASQRMENWPPANVAVEPWLVIPHCQSPGVMGASCQFDAGRAGAVGVGAGVVAVGAGAGAGRLGGATCGTHDGSSMAPVMSGNIRSERELESRRRFAFMSPVWNDKRLITSAHAL